MFHIFESYPRRSARSFCVSSITPQTSRQKQLSRNSTASLQLPPLARPLRPETDRRKTNGFIRIAITITIIQEQIHKSYINSTAARRSPHRFRRTCCPLPQHLQGSLACLSSGRRPGPGSHCLGRSTAAGREPHRFQGICCPLRLHLQ